GVMNLTATTGRGLSLPSAQFGSNSARDRNESAYQLVLRKLREHGKVIKEDRSGRAAQAQCPAHADNSPSLRVSVGNSVGAVINCYAGCDRLDILSALGLTMADLFDVEPEYHHRSTAGYGNSAAAVSVPVEKSARKYKRHGRKE